MTPRDVMRAAMAHEETPEVPYTVAFEDETDLRLDDWYGSTEWRGWITPYITRVAAVDTDLRTPVDATHYRDGYGGLWRSDRRPWHLETPPLAEPSFEGYTFPKPDAFFRPDWKAAARETIAATPDSYHVADLGWGLFERTWGLRGFENALMDAVAVPDFFEEALDRLTELYLAFVEYTADLPVDAILFGDDWGGQRGVILGAKRWRRFLKPRWARIYERVHAAGKLVMHHSCGSVAEIMPDMIEIGMDVLESVQPEAEGMNPYGLKAQWGDRIGFWGALGSQSTLPFGTPEEVRAEVGRLKAEMGQGGGYILAPAKPLQAETPMANAAAMVEAFTGRAG